MTSETGTKPTTGPTTSPNGQHDKTTIVDGTDGQHDKTEGQHDGPGTGGDGEVGTEGQHD